MWLNDHSGGGLEMLALASAAPRGSSPRSARLFLLLSFDRKNVFARKKASRCGNVGEARNFHISHSGLIVA